MTKNAAIFNKLFELTRGDLENSSFAFPQLNDLIDSLTMVRIVRLSNFWDTVEGKERASLEGSIADLITGLYGQSSQWMLLIKGTNKDIQCWFGLPRRLYDEAALQLTLAGSFPDLRINNSFPIDRSCFSTMRHIVALTGTPVSKANSGAPIGTDQIEKVCRGLYGINWVYSVWAEPIPAVEIVRSINNVSEQIRDTHATFLLKTSAIDQQDRIAQRYVNLLESELERWEQGRACGMWVIHAWLMTDSAVSLARAQALLHSAFAGDKTIPVPIRIRPCQADVRHQPLPVPLTSLEAAVLARLPHEEYPGYEISEYARFGVAPNNNFTTGRESLLLGEIFDRGVGTGNSLQMSLNDLTKHGLIAGVTGSGKTNTCFFLLNELWDNGKGVPFLVIESAKSEYRALLRNPRFKGLNIFTVGDEVTSPLRLNPFEVPKGILVQKHIDYLKSLFSAAFVLYPPMPYVLEQSIQEIYEERGWDLARNTNARGDDSSRLYPTLSDLAVKIGIVVERMGYDERITMDVKAGLLARINQLRLGSGKGMMLSARKSVGDSVLFESPCILELKQIVNDDEKAFVIGLILIRLYEFYEADEVRRKGGLRHITLIEEAHRLLRNVSSEKGSEINANPRGHSIEVFANILSEIRAYGEGILIAEQIPTKLTPEAIKNTSLKIIHRLVAEDDRTAVGSTMNMTSSQQRYLSTLQVGEVVVYIENFSKPVLLKIPLSPPKSDNKELSAQEIRAYMQNYWQRNGQLQLPLLGCIRCPAKIPGRSCSNRESDSANDLLKLAFRRLFNSFRVSVAAVMDSYSDFSHFCQRHGRKAQNLTPPYCLFVELIESEVERRGEFWNWSYDNVEKLIDLSCSLIARLSSQFDRSSRASLEKEIIGEFITLRDLFDQLYQTGNLPYAGCRFCSAPCHYRYDMQHPSSSHAVRRFRSGFMDTSIRMAGLAAICWDSVTEIMPTGVIEVLKAASLCFAVQQFGDLGLSRPAQVEMSKQMANCLKDFEEK